MRNLWSMFWTQMILCSWAIVSKLNVVVLRQTGHFFDENNWEVAWAMLLVVDCGSWCCFKRPFEDVGDVHVCDRSVKLESFRFTAFFSKTVYSLSIFMCYWDIICVLVKVILELDWLMHFNIKLLIPSCWELCHRENNAVSFYALCWLPLFWCLLTKLY